MRSTYRHVLGRRDILSALVPYLLGRLPLSMAPLAVLLLVRAESGSFHRAGLATAAYVVGVAVAGPMLGRQVDRRGQGPVLLLCGLLHPAAMAAVAFSALAHEFWLVLVTAVAAGVSLPPVSACMRVLWSRLLDDEASRRAGFAVEGVIVEAAELTGPLLVTLMLVVSRPAAAVIVSGGLTGLSALLFRVTSASREVPPAGNSHRWGALALPGVRRLLVVVAMSTATIGAVEVAVTAYARNHGGAATTGLYIALISVGGIVGGLMFGGAGRLTDRRGPMSLVGMLVLTALTSLALAGSMRLAYAIVALFIFGATVACGVIVQLGMMAAVSTEDVRTEAFTWGGTANFVGLGVGTWVAGWVVDSSGLSRTFLVAAIPAVVAAAAVVVSRRELTTTPVGPVYVESTPDVVGAVEPSTVEMPVADTLDAESVVTVSADRWPELEDDVESVVVIPNPQTHPVEFEPVELDDVSAPEPADVEEPVAEVAVAAAPEISVTELPGAAVVPTPTALGVPLVAAVPDPDPLVAEVEELREQIALLESALETALAEAAGAQAVADANERARRMLERADAACLEMRQRAEDDAARVRQAATEASLEVLSAADRDARAMLERARRDAEVLLSRARQAAIPQQTERPPLHALPAVDETDDRHRETL